MDYYFYEYPLKSFLASLYYHFFPKEKTDTDTAQRYGNLSEFVPNYTDISSQTWRWFKRNRSLLALLSVGAFQRRHDPHRWLQHEEGYERKCHHQGIIPVAGCEMNPECCSVQGSNTSVTNICGENHFVVLFLKLQIWDIGGQPRFRSMWERYCRGVNAIVWAL